MLNCRNPVWLFRQIFRFGYGYIGQVGIVTGRVFKHVMRRLVVMHQEKRFTVIPFAEQAHRQVGDDIRGMSLVLNGIVGPFPLSLDIPEGCVINKMLQPDNLRYDAAGKPLYKISCCLLNQEITPEL